MTVTLDDYRSVSPPGSVDILRRMSEKLRGRSLLQVNSSRVLGGVAEILQRHIPLLQELGIDARWETIEGGEAFEATSLAFYRSLQGEEERVGEEMLQEYVATNRRNAQALSLAGDMVVVHDPPPAPLVDFRPQAGKWV